MTQDTRVSAAQDALLNELATWGTQLDLRVTAVLDAGDAVMFSEEAVKNAVAAVCGAFSVEREVGEYDATAVYGLPEHIVRTVIASLKSGVK